MRVYKFIIDITNMNDDINSQLDASFKSIFGKVDDHVAYTDGDNKSEVIMYLYTDENGVSSSVYDILLDFRLIISVEDITDGVKIDWCQFKGIDETVSNYRLLDKFLKSEFSDDFILDYISNNGQDKFKSQILEKFFPKF